MSWWAVGAAVASAVIQQYNANQVAKKQNKAATASILQQQELQRQANQKVNENIDELEQSSSKDEYQGRSSQIRNQLRQKQAMALAGLQNTGGSEAVTSMVGAAKPTAIGYGDDINKWISGIDAAKLQRQGEAFDRADVESGLNNLRRESAVERQLLQLKMAGIRPNPWLNMLSEGLSAYAGAKGFGGGNTMSGGGQGLTNLGGQTAQSFYADGSALNALPSMSRPLQGNPYGIGSIYGGGI